jgi:hypothetical protein
VEFAALDWVDLFNHRPILEPIGNVLLQKPSLATVPPWTICTWPHH